ncbi:LOW QUALITY PROTEIN: Acyl-CoA:lysophosphatidylglycerol acyltransferase 1, partial [Galemys pyrenaicus]
NRRGAGARGRRAGGAGARGRPLRTRPGDSGPEPLLCPQAAARGLGRRRVHDRDPAAGDTRRRRPARARARRAGPPAARNPAVPSGAAGALRPGPASRRAPPPPRLLTGLFPGPAPSDPAPRPPPCALCPDWALPTAAGLSSATRPPPPAPPPRLPPPLDPQPETPPPSRSLSPAALWPRPVCLVSRGRCTPGPARSGRAVGGREAARWPAPRGTWRRPASRASRAVCCLRWECTAAARAQLLAQCILLSSQKAGADPEASMAVTLDAAARLAWTVLRALLRFAFMVANNLVAISSYVCYVLLLQPLRLLQPRLFWRLEGLMYKWLLGMVASWGWCAGYTVMEWGDDVGAIAGDEAVMLVNHQATGDVCTLMMCLQDKGPVVAQMMWLMDHIFKYTNFGIVSLIHGDFFIRQGKSHRDQQLVLLKKHLESSYRSRDRKWIVLFPEGGFLRKRRETSQAFARKNHLPLLTHVTLPRVGATSVILDALVARPENGSPAGGDARERGACPGRRPVSAATRRPFPRSAHAARLPRAAARRLPAPPRRPGLAAGAALRCPRALSPVPSGGKAKGLQWVIDTTIAYPRAEPIDIQTWILAYRRPTGRVLPAPPSNPVPLSRLPRIFPVKDVPLETEGLTSWLYQRFIEKEDLLSHFYRTGAFPPAQGQKDAVAREMTLSNLWILLIQSFAFLSGYMWYCVAGRLYRCLF